MASDDKCASRRIKWEVVTEAGIESLLGEGIELLSCLLGVRGVVAAITAEFRE